MVVEKPPTPTSRDEFEIAIACTRALEYDAVCLLLDDFWDTDGDPFGRARGDLNTYTTGCMGKYNIVVVLLCKSGKATAAGATASLRSSYPYIEILLLVGICEGVPDANGEELLLGDVVISETVIQYDLGRQLTNTFKEKDTLEDRLGRANKNIRNFIANIKTDIGYQRLEEKVALRLAQIQNRTSEAKYQQRRRAATYKYPGSASDILFKSTYCHRHYNSLQCACADNNPTGNLQAVCDESRDLDCEQTGCELIYLSSRNRLHQKNLLENGGDVEAAQNPSIFFGRFGSGDTTFSSGIHRDSLAQKHNIIAFEMEGAGVWDELPCIIVKGVSDYGDGHKPKNWAAWQNFAAAASASVAMGLVERYPQTDKSPATMLKRQENKACLDALFITNPEDDKQRIEDTKGGLLLAAYIWIVRSEEFLEWLQDPETHLLWIKGGPGKGKTMLLCGIINELKTKPGCNIYYFLCQAADIRLNNAAAVLRGLLHAIVIRHPSLISYIKEEYDKSGKSAFEGTNSWIVLSRIFDRILKDPSLKKPIFIIDALDECLLDLAQLLEVIVKSSSSSAQIKWLVSSRNEADIQEVLATAENKSTVSLELNAESVSVAIITFIRYRLQLLSDKKGYKQSTRDNIEKYLCENADGTFLWVALVCTLLEKAPRSDPLPKSTEFPPGLDHLYERMTSRVCDPSISDLARRVLAIATVARRPLTEQEFIPLINTDDYDEEGMQPSEYDWEDILGHCGSFLTLRNHTIYFVHQSAKDFLVKHAIQRIFPNGTEYVHREILEASISAMRNSLSKDMYGLVDPAFSIDKLSQNALSHDPLVPIRYCCVYWIDHFEQSMPEGHTNDDGHSKSHRLIYTFLQEKYIYWLEALSLLRSIFDGMAGMQRLEQLVANTEISGLLELTWDAGRFIQMFGITIADFPLQVYLSALVFSPTQSITRRLFGNEASEWVQSLPDREVGWAPFFRTYEESQFGSIYHLAASYCGTWVASGFSDAKITIWETYSGKITRTLDMYLEIPYNERPSYSFEPASAEFVYFSPWKNEELASSWFGDKYVTTLDVTTGKVLQKLCIGTGTKSISYSTSAPNILGCLSKSSDDGMNIASFWNTKTGQMTKRIQLQESDKFLELFRFSPTDDSKIARWEGKWRGPSLVKIMDINTGSAIHILECETGLIVEGMKFSLDGSLLAVLGKNSYRPVDPEAIMCTIALLDTTSGKTQWTFRYTAVQWDELAFAFSADGKLLAIATDEAIQIFNTTSGEVVRKIIMTSHYLLFSSDGRKLFSVYYSSINVVEMDIERIMAPGSSENPLEGKIINRSQVSISPNGRLVASRFADPFVIEVMDTDSRIPTQILRSPLENEGTSMLFSPDSRKLVVMLDIEMILWNISSKPAKIISTRKSASFGFMTRRGTFRFSPDSECLATMLDGLASYNMSRTYIKVWDTGSGKCLMYLEKKEQARSGHLFFTPDSRRLAISWLVGEVIRVEIWEIASTSAIQTIDLSCYDPYGHLNISSPHPNSWSSSEEEDQEDGEAGEGEGEGEGEDENPDERGIDAILELSFLGESHLLLDARSMTKKLRVALRTRTDLELTGKSNSDMFRFTEAKSYDVDSTQSWIELDGEKLVWIPPQYRNGARDAQRNCVALTHDTGFLSIIQFRHGVLPKQISPSNASIMGHVSRLPAGEAYRYLRELGNNWKIIHHEMNPPDDKICRQISRFDEIKDTLSIAHQKAKKKYSDWKPRTFGYDTRFLFLLLFLVSVLSTTLIWKGSISSPLQPSLFP